MKRANRTFQNTKRELADLDEHYLSEIVRCGALELDNLRAAFHRGEATELAVEVTEISQQLAELGLWVVQREQQSRGN
jgi:hypothetical protein